MSLFVAMTVGLWAFVSGGLPGETARHLNAPVVHSASTPAAPSGITFPNFKAKDFPFVTTVPDDGEGKAGGWQVAKVNLEFVRIIVPTDVRVWHCPFNIEMPLRTEFMGKVDANRAASFSVEITNRVALDMDYKLPQGIFCHEYLKAVDALFKSRYPKLGATAKKS